MEFPRSMRHSAIAALMGLGSSLPAAIAQPANNACANAITITPGSVTGTTVAATNDATASCGSSSTSPDVWYRITASMDGELSVQTCGGATWDTVLSIWSNCPASGGGEIACEDDGCSLQTPITAPITAGNTYYIRVAGFNGQVGAFTMSVVEQEGPPPPTIGGDVVYSDISGVSQYGPIGGIYAYAYGTGTCNIGDADLRWGNSWAGSPSVGFNAYRLHNGRLLQLGQSWVKRACCAAAGSGCGIACNGNGGSVLGTGCKDVYGSGYNGSQSVLAKRSSLNAFTGTHALVGGSGDAIYGRLQILASDLVTANFPGAQYFAEGVYVGSDDAAGGNAHNNASYTRLGVAANGVLATQAPTYVGDGAIYAWRDHGGGPNIEDPNVSIDPLDIPDEGRFIVGHTVRDLGNGTWRYDYAILNINSDLSGGSFSVPLPASTTVTNAGFHDVPYHSGEPYDNTDWTTTVGANSVTWASPQTFAQNPNSNALRWGTMYNFWFDANRPPANGSATFGLFKPHSTQSVPVTLRVPSAPGIPGDLDNDGDVDLADLAMMLSNFGCNTPPCVADINGDGQTDLGDLAILLANFGS